MRRSVRRWKYSIISPMPRGNAFSASVRSMPVSWIPRSKAVCVQPSNGTWVRVAVSNFSRKASRSCGAFFLVMASALRQFFQFLLGGRRFAGCRAIAHLLHEGELGEIGHTHGIEYALQMIAFMLHHPRMEVARFALDLPAKQVVAAVADLGEARH